MARSRSLLPLALGGVAALAACGTPPVARARSSGGPAAPVYSADPCPEELGRDAPSDPNGGAPELSAGTVPGCLGGSADPSDLFELRAAPQPGSAVYRLTASPEPRSPSRLCFEILDAARAVARARDSLCAASGGASVSVWVAVMGGTSAYVRLADQAGSAARTRRPYTLSAAEQLFADIEPNQDNATATPIEAGNPIEALFSTPLNASSPEFDVYRLEVAKKGKLTIELSDVDPTVQFAARVRTAGGKSLREKGADRAGESLSFDATVPKGSVFIELRNLAGGGTPAVGAGDLPAYLSRPYRIIVTLR